MVEHVNIADPEIHEPKGVAAADANKVYVSDGAGSGAWKTAWNGWWWNYDHSAVSSTALASGVKTDIANDTLGIATLNFNKLPTASDVWDSGTNSFDWVAGGLSLGDRVTLRIDIEVTVNTNNDGFLLELDLAHGHAGEINLPILEENTDTAGTQRYAQEFDFFIGNTNVLNEPAKLSITSNSAGASFLLNGFYVSIDPVNPVYI